MVSVLLHQGIGLGAFNSLPERRAVHAVYECANSLALARDLVRGRAYASYEMLFRRADALLFGLTDRALAQLLEACPGVGHRPGSTWSRAEQCAVAADDAAVMAELRSSAAHYGSRFGFGFVMCVDGVRAPDVLAALRTRMTHDPDTEFKVLRTELARIHRSRLARMLGPEEGYHNW